MNERIEEEKNLQKIVVIIADYLVQKYYFQISNLDGFSSVWNSFVWTVLVSLKTEKTGFHFVFFVCFRIV